MAVVLHTSEVQVSTLNVDGAGGGLKASDFWAALCKPRQALHGHYVIPSGFKYIACFGTCYDDMPYFGLFGALRQG